jgi:hypothetical protein
MKRLSLSKFPVFVSSLSWQMFCFRYKNSAKKDAFLPA